MLLGYFFSPLQKSLKSRKPEARRHWKGVEDREQKRNKSWESSNSHRDGPSFPLH
jgi:hypothetical protein